MTSLSILKCDRNSIQHQCHVVIGGRKGRELQITIVMWPRRPIHRLLILPDVTSRHADRAIPFSNVPPSGVRIGAVSSRVDFAGSGQDALMR